ncbi:acetyltransferase (GNAT) family protein [Herbihabitans rhizosphaerae]|uniref:Acetyltransferase (GNAT) family protein n=1 Tax=Herbihabitans rhizosphaerae TaxID=1872711 RepID=A0A4Q7KDY9_9PSEU|nr:GNAT family N-acetyltransferase [Herbihabitans rhizosphaerae]RZS31437.1 acetyltransferase (GNAT) family protein [Herbihabitans rhizosphaerae]
MTWPIVPLDLGAHGAEAVALSLAALRTVDQDVRPPEYLAGAGDWPGVVTRCAVDDGRMIGLAVGWPGSTSTWWSDRVRPALIASGTEVWLDGAFEVCELHVHPVHHGRGIGTALLRALLSGRTEERAALSVRAINEGAERFYERHGFTRLTEPFRFDGHGPDYRVLGAPLPLP